MNNQIKCPIKVKELKKITNSKFLNFFELDYIDKQGQTKHWQFASRNDKPKCITQDYSAADAVVIVPYHTEKKKIVVIEEFRVPITSYQYGFPAGLIDEGESLAEAAKRELKEETGLTLTKVLRESPAVFSSTGMTDEAICMIYVECVGEPDNQYNESSEDIHTHFLSPAETKELMQNTSLKFDIKTWLVLSCFAEHGHI